MNKEAILWLGVGVLVGWLVVPMVLGMFGTKGKTA